jgi:hypothetical protein
MSIERVLGRERETQIESDNTNRDILVPPLEPLLLYGVPP